MAIKTNLLYDALITPNIGVEFYLGKGGQWPATGCMHGGSQIPTAGTTAPMAEILSSANGLAARLHKSLFRDGM